MRKKADQGCHMRVNVSQLSIQSNRIVKLEGLENLVKLEELYISHNGLTSIGEGLSANVNPPSAFPSIQKKTGDLVCGLIHC
jgi:Leucine-rich repeat (LRR) protein